MEWKSEKLRSVWKMSKEKLIFLFCSGLLLFLLSLPGDSDSVVTGGSGQRADFSNGEERESIIREASSQVSGIAESYEGDLEMRITEILRDVDGVGEVEVMVVLKASEEAKVYSGFSEKSVYPELSGVVISADGGGSAVVKSEISEAMEALFGLPPHKIKVLKRVKKGV